MSWFKSNPGQRRTKRLLRGGLAILLGALILAAPWLVPAARRHYQYGRQLAAHSASLLETGRLFPLAQLHELYPAVPEEQNAAVLYQRAFAGLVECKDVPIYGEAELPDPAAPLSGSTRQAIEECLRRHTEPLVLIREAASIPGCRFRVDFEEGFEVRLPHLAAMKRAGRLLALTMIHHAEAEQGAEVARAMSDALGLAEHLGQGPFLIDQLVETAHLAHLFQAVERSLHRCRLAPEAMAELDRRLVKALHNHNWRRAINSERSMVFSLFHGPAEATQRVMSDQSLGFELSWTAYRLRGNLKRDCCFYLDFMERLDQAADLSASERLGHIQDLESELQTNKALVAGHVLEMNILSGMFLPSTFKFAERMIRREAMLLLLRAGVAVERFRADRGVLPSSLSELVPHYLDSEPIDPYAAGPFIYSLTAEGCLLSSSAPGWVRSGESNPSPAHPLRFELRR